MTIDVKCLSFSYRRKPVLQNTTFSAHSGEIICLLGRNGAGKSTLFRCVLGLLQGYHGQINIDGREIRQMTQHERAVRMAYIPQSNAPLFGHSVFHMVLMGRTAHLGPSGRPARRDEQIALDMLARLGISHLASSSYAGISGGERQMVLIARAMAQQAGIVIMDEPTANLDMGNQARVMDQVTRLRQEGYLIILSTHNPQQALSYADRVLALQNGVILAEGPPEQVITEALLEQIYGAPFKIYDIPQENGYLRKVCLPVQPIMSTV